MIVVKNVSCANATIEKQGRYLLFCYTLSGEYKLKFYFAVQKPLVLCPALMMKIAKGIQDHEYPFTLNQHYRY